LEQPDAVCTVLSSWWWAKKPPETCRALTVINNIVYRWLYLKEYINDGQSHERQMHNRMQRIQRGLFEASVEHGNVAL
jgi:hypothetical protein